MENSYPNRASYNNFIRSGKIPGKVKGGTGKILIGDRFFPFCQRSAGEGGIMISSRWSVENLQSRLARAFCK